MENVRPGQQWDEPDHRGRLVDGRLRMDVRRNAACVEAESEGTLGVVVGRYSCAFREQELALLQRLGRQQPAAWCRLGPRRLPPHRGLPIPGVRVVVEWNST